VYVCRFLEVDGKCVIGLADRQLYKLLNGKDSGTKVVVLRVHADKPMAAGRALMSDDIESLRDDLSLALMELDEAQSENRRLAAELDQYVADWLSLQFDTENIHWRNRNIIIINNNNNNSPLTAVFRTAQIIQYQNAASLDFIETRMMDIFPSVL